MPKLSIGQWVALVCGAVALLAVTLFQAWISVPLLLVLIVGLSVARLLP
jgi:hypothetical protein